MRRYLWAVSLLALAGCGQNLSLGTEETSTQPAVATRVGLPLDDPDPTLKLVRDGETLVLGDEPVDSVYRLFPKPKTFFKFNELPPGFQAPYEADGWEASTESVGAILYQGKVCAVMRQLPRSKQEDIQRMVADISAENAEVKPTVVQGNRVVYYFWDKAPERIMISGLGTKSNGWNITEVLGVTNVLDALGVSEMAARSDQPKVDLLLKSNKA